MILYFTICCLILFLERNPNVVEDLLFTLTLPHKILDIACTWLYTTLSCQDMS